MVTVDRKNKKCQKSPPGATKKNFYLLRDLMYCAHCGRPISGRKNKVRGEALYYCPNKERAWVENGGKSETPWQRGTGCGFDRSMNIDRADELVWRHVQDLHAKSSLLKEEVKRRVLKEQGLGYVADKDTKKKAEAKVRRLQKDLTAISETIGNVEASRLLKRMDDISYATTMQRLNEEQQRLQTALAEVKLQLQNETVRKKWIDWLDAFGEEVKNTSTYTDEQRKLYVEGIVERIDVRWLPSSREHEMTLHFRLPIVGDGIEWLDEKRKSRGYTMVEGQRTATVTLSKKDGRG